MLLYYTDHYAVPLPEGHKFPMRKYRMLREALERSGRFAFEAAPLAPERTIAIAHDAAYVRGFIAGTLDSSIMRRIGFPWSEQLVLRTLASVGGTIEAARNALRLGWGGTLAGGTHHAFHDHGSGFCVFNDIAVAICALRDEGAIRRASIVDLDVHQGDGTAKLFENEPGVLTISVHGGNNFPFRKQTSKIDVALLDGAGNDEYLCAVTEVLPRALDHRPDIVFYQSGVDALATDKLGRLAVTHEGLAERDRLVLSAVKAAAIPLVITLGGGYSDPIEHTVAAHATTFLTAARLYA